MDPTTADLIKNAYWPAAVFFVLFGGMLLFCRSIGDRIRHAKLFDWSKKSAEFYPSQGTAQGSISESPPGATLPSGRFDEAQAASAIQALVTGWRFERILRVIYPAQLELLLALKNGAVFTDREASSYYEKVPPEFRANITYVSFLQFLISQQLVHNDLSASGEGRYSITSAGVKFLNFRDQIANGVMFPQVNAFDTGTTT